MSVTTTADEKLNSAADHIKEAIRDLSAIVVDECWGHDDFRKEYEETIHDTLMELIALKKKLNR